MLLELAAEGMPDRIAVGSTADGLSYRQLLDRARRGAAVVLASGVERVGLVGTNSPAVPMLLYAGALAGVPFTAVNYRLADERLRSVVERVAPALVVTDEATQARIRDVRGLELLARGELEARLEDAKCAADPDIDTDAVFTDMVLRLAAGMERR